jgi:hypothetical protein
MFELIEWSFKTVFYLLYVTAILIWWMLKLSFYAGAYLIALTIVIIKSIQERRTGRDPA